MKLLTDLSIVLEIERPKHLQVVVDQPGCGANVVLLAAITNRPTDQPKTMQLCQETGPLGALTLGITRLPGDDIYGFNRDIFKPKDWGTVLHWEPCHTCPSETGHVQLLHFKSRVKNRQHLVLSVRLVK